MSTTGAEGLSAAFSIRFTLNELANETGASLRQIRHYRALELVSPPDRIGTQHSYGYAHVLQVKRVRELIDLGWNPAEQVELRRMPTHWAEEGSAADRKQRTDRWESECHNIAVTGAIRIAYVGTPSSLQNRLIRAMLQAGRDELMRQKEIAKSFSRTKVGK